MHHTTEIVGAGISVGQIGRQILAVTQWQVHHKTWSLAFSMILMYLTIMAYFFPVLFRFHYSVHVRYFQNNACGFLRTLLR